MGAFCDGAFTKTGLGCVQWRPPSLDVVSMICWSVSPSLNRAAWKATTSMPSTVATMDAMCVVRIVGELVTTQLYSTQSTSHHEPAVAGGDLPWLPLRAALERGASFGEFSSGGVAGSWGDVRVLSGNGLHRSASSPMGLR
eukprot:1175670-Prorocentrum_minimum.AAC.1